MTNVSLPPYFSLIATLEHVADRLEKHIEEGTVDDFVGTLLTSLSREIGENNFGNSKLSQKDKAYANANFYMFKKIIPFVGYAGN